MAAEIRDVVSSEPHNMTSRTLMTQITVVNHLDENQNEHSVQEHSSKVLTNEAKAATGNSNKNTHALLTDSSSTVHNQHDENPHKASLYCVAAGTTSTQEQTGMECSHSPTEQAGDYSVRKDKICDGTNCPTELLKRETVVKEECKQQILAPVHEALQLQPQPNDTAIKSETPVVDVDPVLQLSYQEHAFEEQKSNKTWAQRRYENNINQKAQQDRDEQHGQDHPQQLPRRQHVALPIDDAEVVAQQLPQNDPVALTLAGAAVVDKQLPPYNSVVMPIDDADVVDEHMSQHEIVTVSIDGSDDADQLSPTNTVSDVEQLEQHEVSGKSPQHDNTEQHVEEQQSNQQIFHKLQTQDQFQLCTTIHPSSHDQSTLQHNLYPLKQRPGQCPTKRRPGRPPGSTKKFRQMQQMQEAEQKSSPEEDFSLRRFFEAGGRDYSEYLTWLKDARKAGPNQSPTVMPPTVPDLNGTTSSQRHLKTSGKVPSPEVTIFPARRTHSIPTGVAPRPHFIWQPPGGSRCISALHTIPRPAGYPSLDIRTDSLPRYQVRQTTHVLSSLPPYPLHHSRAVSDGLQRAPLHHAPEVLDLSIKRPKLSKSVSDPGIPRNLSQFRTLL